MTLPDDAARCGGKHYWANNNSTHTEDAQCQTCLRRTVQPGERWSYILPPEFVQGKCPERIAE